MTIPTRPAPAPPGRHDLNAAAGANVSLEQLRQQLQEQQQHQLQYQRSQRNEDLQMLTIKLPPPPGGGRSLGVGGGGGNGVHLNNSLHHRTLSAIGTNNSNNININNNNNNNNINNDNIKNNGSITRKFPPANVRYAPVTSWDDSLFEVPPTMANGNYKKVPPPRPPPPKLPMNNKKKSAPIPPQSINILNNIFHRKRFSKVPALKLKSNNRNCGGSFSGSENSSHSLNANGGGGGSGSEYNSITTTSSSSHSSSFFSQTFSTSAMSAMTANHFNGVATTTTAGSTKGASASHHYNQEAQLISFDTPPGSPTFTQKSNSDCVSVDSFSSDSNFSSPNNGSASQPESGFEDDFSMKTRSTSCPLDPWENVQVLAGDVNAYGAYTASSMAAPTIGTAPVRNANAAAAFTARTLNNKDNPLCNGKSLLPPAATLAMPTIIKPKISQKPKAPKPPILQNKNNTYNATSILETNAMSSSGHHQVMFSTPMPAYAPPPPPPSSENATLLDVIAGKADALQLEQRGVSTISEPPYGVALYDFKGIEDDDLSFRENEKIYLLEQVSEEWYRGRTRRGCEGIFPANYIEVRIPLTGNEQEETTTPYNRNNTTAAEQTLVRTNTRDASDFPLVKCLYNFPAEVDGDLDIKENDMVMLFYKINDDWLYGSVNGRQGQFPANFLEYVPDHLPML